MQKTKNIFSKMKKILFLFLFSFFFLGFSGEYDVILNDMNGLLQNIEADTNEITDIYSQTITIEDVLRDMYTTSQSIYSILSTRPFTDISTNVFTIANRLSQTNTALADLKTSVDSAASAVSSIDTSTQSIDTKIGTSNTHLANVNTKLTTLTTEVSTIKSDVASMKTDLHSVAQTMSSGTSPTPPTRIQSLPVPSDVSAIQIIKSKIFPPSRLFNSDTQQAYQITFHFDLPGHPFNVTMGIPLDNTGNINPGDQCAQALAVFFDFFRTALLLLLMWCFVKVIIKTLRQW